MVPGALTLFVGTMSDLREGVQMGRKPLDREAISSDLQKEYSSGYIECSSLTGEGIEEVFDWAVSEVLSSRG